MPALPIRIAVTASSLAVSTIIERLPVSAKAFRASTEMRPLAIETSFGRLVARPRSHDLELRRLAGERDFDFAQRRRRMAGLAAAPLLDIGDDVVASLLAAGEVQSKAPTSSPSTVSGWLRPSAGRPSTATIAQP